MPSINIPVNDSPLSTLQSQAKDAAKEVAKLQKSIDKARKDGTQVADDVIKKLGAAEQRHKSLQEKIKTDGARMRYEERHGFSGGVGNFTGMMGGNINDVVRQGAFKAFDSLAAGPSFLRRTLSSKGFNAMTGGAGKQALEEGIGPALEGVASKVHPYVALGIMAVKAAGETLKIASPYSEQHRLFSAEMGVRLANSDYTGSGRALDIKRTQFEANEHDLAGRVGGSWLSMANPLGMAVRAFALGRNRYQGVDATSTAKAEREQAMRDSGYALDADAISEIAETRGFADTYGSAVGWAMQNTQGRLRKLIGDNGLARENTEASKKVAESFAKFTALGDAAAIKGDFGGASAAYKSAGDEVGKSNWRDPLNVWSGNQESIKAAKMFALSQNPLPPLRRGQN